MRKAARAKYLSFKNVVAKKKYPKGQFLICDVGHRPIFLKILGRRGSILYNVRDWGSRGVGSGKLRPDPKIKKVNVLRV